LANLSENAVGTAIVSHPRIFLVVDEDQWALLHDGSDTADDAGYIAIVHAKDGRWG
jgi:hypothetical protein